MFFFVLRHFFIFSSPSEIAHFKPSPLILNAPKHAFFIFPIFAANNNAAPQMWTRAWHWQQHEYRIFSLFHLSHKLLSHSCLIFSSFFQFRLLPNLNEDSSFCAKLCKIVWNKNSAWFLWKMKWNKEKV